MNKLKQRKGETKKKTRPAKAVKIGLKKSRNPVVKLNGKNGGPLTSRPQVYNKVLFESALDGIIIIDGSTGIIKDVNPSLQKLSGYSQKELIGKKFWRTNSFKGITDSKRSFINFLTEPSGTDNNLYLRTKEEQLINVEVISNYFSLKNENIVLCIIKDITKSLQTVELLKHERNLLRTIINSLPDAIYVKDTACRKTVVNQADVNNIGLKSEKELIGKSDFEVFPKDLAEGFFVDDQLVINTGKPVDNREEFLITPDGRKKWLLTSKLPLRDEKKNIIGLIGIGRDITKRKELEGTLENERNLLQTIIDNIPDLIYFKDVNGRYVRNNRAHLHSLGAERQSDVLGKTTFDFNPHELAQEYHEDEMRIIRTAKPLIEKEEIAFHKDTGKKYWHLTSKIPLKDHSGKVVGIIGISRDITAFKEAERKIYKLNRVYEILSNVNQAIVRTRDIKTLFSDICKIVVRDGKLRTTCIGVIDDEKQSVKITAINGYNGSFIETLNFNINQHEYKNSPSVTSIETLEYCVCNDIESDERMAPWRQIALKDGYRSSCTFPIIVFGKLFGLIHIFSDQKYFFDEEEMKLLDEMAMDVSFCIETLFNEEKRKKSEEALIRTKEKAEEANRLKNSFLARMSHELRTPINGILGSSNIIKESFYNEANDTMQKIFDSMEDESYRLLNTMTQIFDISSIESEDFKIVLKPLSLNNMVLSSHKNLRYMAEKKILQVDLDLPENEIMVQGDEYCLKNIIQNVLNNAIKFSKHGTISIKISQDDNYGICSVNDEGIGMSDDYQKHLFELFSQEDVGYSRPFDGAGLGLALAHKYIEFMKGDIKITSKKGVGTNVIFKIPLIKKDWR